MSRIETVELNKRACNGDPVAALALLEHSMARGHGRIGLLRYLHARCVGAVLARRHHDYAERVISRMSAGAFAALVAQAQRRFGSAVVEPPTRAHS